MVVFFKVFLDLHQTRWQARYDGSNMSVANECRAHTDGSGALRLGRQAGPAKAVVLPCLLCRSSRVAMYLFTTSDKTWAGRRADSHGQSLPENHVWPKQRARRQSPCTSDSHTFLEISDKFAPEVGRVSPGSSNYRLILELCNVLGVQAVELCDFSLCDGLLLWDVRFTPSALCDWSARHCTRTLNAYQQFWQV